MSSGKDKPKTPKEREDEMQQLYARVFTSPEGQVVFHAIMKYCKAGMTPFVADNERLSNFRCGQHDVAKHIQTQVSGGSS